MTQTQQPPTRQPADDGLLAQAVHAVHSDHIKRARFLFIKLVTQDPEHEQGWQWLASLSPDLRQARSYLHQVLRVNPKNRVAIAGLRRVDAHLRQDRMPRNQVVARSWQVAEAATEDNEPGLSASRVQQQPSTRRRGFWLFAVAVLTVMGGLLALNWLPQSTRAAATDLKPTATSTLAAAVAPTLSPTPSVGLRVAKRVSRLEQAWQTQNWQAAVEVLEDISSIDQTYPGLGPAKCETYLRWGRQQVDEGRIKEAYDLYQRASVTCQDATEAETGKALALNYLSGRRKHDQELWREAATLLQMVYDKAPGYADTHLLLYSSYLSWSEEALGESRLKEARQAGEAALELKPGSREAKALLKEIKQLLKPTPTPVPPNPRGKLIEVNISQQRMYVWEGDRLLYKWLCSTGEPGRGTAAGRYRVLDKIPEAWASTWGLRMPYWLGIYWSGTLENGIHALPINRSGQTLWAGYLGTPVSFGCVILSTANAYTLFNWAEVGTPVWIHY